MEKANAMMEEVAKQIAAGATTASAIAAAAAAKGLKAQEQKAYIVGTPLGQGPSASTSPALSDAIYALKAGEAAKGPIKAGDTWYVVGVTNREDANMDEFAKQRDALAEQMRDRKKSVVFQDYVASTRRRMEADGQIKIYEDAIARLDEAMTPAAPAE